MTSLPTHDSEPLPDVADPVLTLADLTRRERVVLSNLGDGVTLDEVAARLFVSRNTVKSQVRSLYRKLGVTTRREALEWADRIGR